MYATTWRNLENLLRDERIQKNMTTYYSVYMKQEYPNGQKANQCCQELGEGERDERDC